MKITNWILTFVAGLLVTIGLLDFGARLFEKLDSQILTSVIPLSLGIVLFGLLHLVPLRHDPQIQVLISRALLQGAVGCALILCWWVVIERPRITHQDILEACQAIKSTDLSERECYYRLILKP